MKYNDEKYRLLNDLFKNFFSRIENAYAYHCTFYLPGVVHATFAKRSEAKMLFKNYLTSGKGSA
jgi:hypothetical protein